MTEISNVWLQAICCIFNSNCIARMKSLTCQQLFYIPALLQLATRGQCFTPNPDQVDLNQINAGIIHCSMVKTYRTMTHILLFAKKYYTVPIKIKKKVYASLIFLTYNLSLGFCRLLHPSAAELGLCVDVHNMALQLLIWSMHHADMRK